MPNDHKLVKKVSERKKYFDKGECDYFYGRFCFALAKLKLTRIRAGKEYVSAKTMYRAYLENIDEGFSRDDAFELTMRLRELRVARMQLDCGATRAKIMVEEFRKFKDEGYNNNDSIELTIRWAADEWGIYNQTKINRVVKQVVV